MSQPLTIVIVEKTGILKSLSIKDFKEEELFKKCGFKKAEDFIKQNEWSTKYYGKKYIIQVFAKTDGRANNENKYDFPPPIDNTLFFGNCAIIALSKNNNGNNTFVDLSVSLWEKIYEKLFGGFESLAVTAVEDDEEEDELANVPKEKKTKQGYLKDGFVIDSGSESEDKSDIDSSEEDDTEEDNTEEEEEEEGILEDIGSELSEESYDYESSTDEIK